MLVSIGFSNNFCKVFHRQKCNKNIEHVKNVDILTNRVLKNRMISMKMPNLELGRIWAGKKVIDFCFL